jgi:hypothetical protein
MRSERALAAIFAAGLILGAACSEPESFILLSLRTTVPTPIDNVAQIQVRVAGSRSRLLVYEAHGVSINQVDERTLSVGFSHGETGNVTFTVDLLNNLGCSIANGKVTQKITKGSTAQATVSLDAFINCSIADGGTPEVSPGSTLPGCDPVNPQRALDGGIGDAGNATDGGADGGILTCTSTQTCQVDCTPPNNAAPRNECVPGGTGAPGTTCMTNADCQPGTQCFNYASTGCEVRVCLRFCNTGADCAAFGASGAGPGSFCEGPVMCPALLTAYHTCTFNCDPRATAASSHGGCPAMLACVMPAAMDAVDCACPGTTRTKTEGEPCTQAADCAPGFICNQMSGTKVCRAICRCDANAAGTCTATATDCPKTGTTCRAVTNNTIYGVCL